MLDESFFRNCRLVMISCQKQMFLEAVALEPSLVGQWTFIYLSGRLSQICLNIRRVHVEGLNPLMFLFAVIGNATYVASIVVISLDWSKIRPNLPWLVDAGGCVLLDFFILMQFIYFRCWTSQAL
ncbi:hypothetical protein GLYMA_19G123451v4 [Glycine max]|nr:hypothetical protein GLYMA_19G123451v4 [Glycine max]KAH1077504.1 hypothetical protein GYH30_052843 [Glycine max]